ncbi:gfo/Idh/MocA family oxidoreductase [Sinorhizobium medicae]|uniref:Oxidoreductase domain protein n=3 Tax=Sinorhizobium medicae TaxID=110321 RepID=A6UB41_SINMW|nr:Gfo/Idh/MocA family oxidoreductase [Sinorhizobium medicae]ABR60871.1 oxidoreductase domain protein [Sinorhizobium medicae WSM419]MBO1943812.1 Gfo/Idh/MocA family oxidoreductase [Sinorhizobium medicae]MBO1964890.1 Gfo/Idh/MocA family oxidoreductase [Sinorhizobium medicae]MDX0407029.1 gfo/Idh/MocA family oxidoreductase [Sinorhizobium medicae]MDX0412545.1 gfo/Idh/MocA family oxidoreductase [Sinorhizobium medicae]
MSKPDESDYALETAEVPLVDAPVLNYRPPRTRSYAPGIAVVGAGGISFAHLDAYRSAGYDVRVICNRTLSKAIERRDAFFPSADISDDFDSVIRRDDIDVVDITTHPIARAPMIESALRAGKHVLSQKPFVLDLDAGLRLVEIAEQQGLKLAVNQNGRWAPHLGYMREAVTSGVIGDLMSCHIGVHWNHGWIRGTPFENIDDLVFQDFAIHWFDFLASVIGNRATSVIATRTRASGQSVAPPLLAQALVQFEGGQASLVFDGSVPYGPLDRTYIAGTKGSLSSWGPNLGRQSVELSTENGIARPVLSGTWFNDGFRGAMGELLCAIEDGREPLHNARANLDGLALTFAAIASCRRLQPVTPWGARTVTI